MVHKTKEERDAADAAFKQKAIDVLTQLESVSTIEDFLGIIRSTATWAKAEIAKEDATEQQP